MISRNLLKQVSSLGLVCILLFLAQCGGNGEDPLTSAASLLPKSFGETISRTGDVRVYAGESLWEYINGDAELYHQYDFVEAATADYSHNGLEILCDIYRFAASEGAYGLYTSVRPTQPVEIEVGTNGFAEGSTVTFVRGDFVVRLVAYNDPGSAEVTLLELAEDIAGLISGSTESPTAFSAFPTDHAIRASERIYAASFQGYSFLTKFYGQRYDIEGDTIELFFTRAESVEKLRRWIEASPQATDMAIDVDGLSYDSDQTLVLDTFSGVVVAGTKGAYLAGMINYSAEKQDFLTAWLASLSD